MKNIRISIATFTLLVTIALVSAFTCTQPPGPVTVSVPEEAKTQTVNLFVTHGHCSTPFSGTVRNLQVNLPVRSDGGNPLEQMEMSFAIDPNSFRACAGDEFTASVRTPGLFCGANNQMLTFRSTAVYTMGMDWYQINGVLSIKGVEKNVKFFASGIRKPDDQMPGILVLEGQLNLYDWGIDYDQIVNGESGRSLVNPTQWMHLNMKIDMC
ncbi:MAG: YceI family protein [Owenweeksia sp.]